MCKNVKILVVDDEPTNLKIFSRILAKRFQLDMAKNGDEAMQKLVSFQPDIIILDVMLPDTNGHTICRNIREMADQIGTRIIMVSAKAVVSERVAGYESGADDYMTKPFDPSEFLARVCALSKMVRQSN